MNEDWDDMTVADPLAGEELERLLARYARVRLDPSHAQSKRARSAVMEDAWRRRIEATRVDAGRPARRLPFAGWSMRRMSVSLTAAVVAGLMLGTSAFAASRAGGPLYAPRLALEELGYPTDPDARVDAQLQAAQVRLAEAVEAAGRHDDGATSAALAAYDDTLDDLASASGQAADRALLAIQFHHGVLEQIAARAPAAAQAGLDRAIANSERLMDRLAAADTDPDTHPGNGQGDGPGNGPGGVANPGPGVGPGGGPAGGPTADPTASPKPPGGKPTEAPDPTPKPTRPPKPTPEPEPAATDTPDPTAAPDPAPPDRTPRPRPSNAGGPNGDGPNAGGPSGERERP